MRLGADLAFERPSRSAYHCVPSETSVGTLGKERKTS